MKIGVDLDDVLSQSTSALIKFHNNNYGTNFDIKNLKNYKLMTILGNNKEDAEKKIYEFHTSSYGKDARPLIDSKEILEKLKQNNELYVITARGDNIKNETERWIEVNFPNIFTQIYLTNEFLKEDSKITKRTVCDEVGIDIFIEDNLDYALECTSPNRKVYLLDYPWNQTDKLPEGIVRVNTWKEMEKILIKKDL